MILFIYLLAVIFITPVIATVYRRQIKQQRKSLIIVTCQLSIVILLSRWADISFIGYHIDTVAVFALYALIGLCSIQLVIDKHILLKIAGAITALPMLLMPFLFIPGMVVTLFTVGELFPRHAFDYKNGLECRVTARGNATTRTGGYVATLYKEYFLLFEFKVAQSAEMPKHARLLCTDLLKQHLKSG